MVVTCATHTVLTKFRYDQHIQPGEDGLWSKKVYMDCLVSTTRAAETNIQSNFNGSDTFGAMSLIIAPEQEAKHRYLFDFL